jgi:hypothetical protein
LNRMLLRITGRTQHRSRVGRTPMNVPRVPGIP